MPRTPAPARRSPLWQHDPAEVDAIMHTLRWTKAQRDAARNIFDGNPHPLTIPLVHDIDRYARALGIDVEAAAARVRRQLDGIG